MPLPFPAEWIDCPPRYIVAGDGVYARGLAQVLADAVLISDEVLEHGIECPTFLKERGIRPAPLADVDAVLVILSAGESPNSTLWRHRRLWMLPGGFRQAKWLFVASDKRQVMEVSEMLEGSLFSLPSGLGSRKAVAFSRVRLGWPGFCVL